jgi:hypothetical protein
MAAILQTFLSPILRPVEAGLYWTAATGIALAVALIRGFSREFIGYLSARIIGPCGIPLPATRNKQACTVPVRCVAAAHRSHTYP